MSSDEDVQKMLSMLHVIFSSPTFGKLLYCKRLVFTPGWVSGEVFILMPPPILEGLKLVYLCSSEGLCCGSVGKQKFC